MKKQNERKGDGVFSNRFNRQFGFGSETSMTQISDPDLRFTDHELLGENEVRFKPPVNPLTESVLRESNIIRSQIDKTEDKFNQFDSLVFSEGITIDNFKNVLL